MKRHIDIELRTYNSLEEASLADIEEVSSLTGEERLQHALSIMAPYYEVTPRLERVYRVVEQSELPISDGWSVGL